jgi:putative transposase
VISFPGPKSLRASLHRLRRASRAHSRRMPGSANRRMSAARLARIHARAAHIRADALHKATTQLAVRYETVVAEDLNVTGMLANRRLARAIADQGFGRARRMLGYKTAWNGGSLVIADRLYPSSKICSACGWRKPSLTLGERTFTCDACGLVLDRDQNAARNLLKLAASGAESTNACRAAVRPGHTGHAAMKQEPGTAHAGKTGTASGQPLAARHVGASAH